MPATRFGSIVSLQYQIALALTAPQHLQDVERTPLVDTPALRRLMSRIRVQRARDLDSRYPKAWPARVSINGRGQVFTSLVVHPKGDARRPFDWADVEQKFVRLTGSVVAEKKAQQMVSDIRRANRHTRMPGLWDRT
jgi:2-methylcitrate dehydratase PrpD